MAEDVKITGLRELAETLRELPNKMTRKVLNESLRVGGKLIADEARILAPKETGTLRRNIVYGAVRPEPGMNATVLVYVRKFTRRQIKARQARNIRKGRARNFGDPYYWRFQEFGTSQIKGTAYMRRGFEHKKRTALDQITADMRKRIYDEAEKLGRR